MARMLVVAGDRLHLGGAVVSGSPYTDIDGRAVARVNDPVVCAVHGPGVIASGDVTLIIDGQAVARDGDKASCGCMLLAGKQWLVSVEHGAANANPAIQPAPHAHKEVAGGAAADHYSSAPAPAVPDMTPLPDPQCWVQDYRKHISENAEGRYYQTYDSTGRKVSKPYYVKFHVEIPALRGGDIVVTVKMLVIRQAGVDAEHAQTARERMDAGVDTYWNRRYILEVEDPLCGVRVFPLRYRVEWVAHGQDCVVALHGVLDRENVDASVLNASTATDEFTYAHEFAHCIGIPDEYGYIVDSDYFVHYFRPDGTADAAVIQAGEPREVDDPLATLLSGYEAFRYEAVPRHAWNVAREVQELLRDETGREIACEIRLRR